MIVSNKQLHYLSKFAIYNHSGISFYIALSQQLVHHSKITYE